MHKVWVVVGAAAIVAGGTWVWASAGHGPLSPPDVPRPLSATVQVTLCEKDSPYAECEGRGVATKEDRRAVVGRLGSLTGVTSAGALVVGQLADRGAFPALRASFEGMRGVAGVTARPVSFWQGRTEVRIELCGPKMSLTQCGDPGAQTSATDEQKDAIYERLRNLPDVAEVYVADRNFVEDEARNYLKDGMSGDWQDRADDPNEQFHVKLVQQKDLRGAAQRVSDAIGGLPGVKSVEREGR
ncbi:permease-like cell division protein FtsX [Nonomuraea sp. NPDC050556]|uniref:permease-like cell division protein FtsX n=1 Tax=Nonomuraea sp. NPDC050556 TaxID=3364369 RepID=UPI0037AA659D